MFFRLTTATAMIWAAGSVMAQETVTGESLYFNHCAACHGMELDGQGVMSGVMTIKPKDLTVLAQENDGVFPVLRVVMRIDGRDPLVSHGSPMPVYGDFFEGTGAILKSELGQPIATSEPVVALVEYIEAVQK
ncbi:MAG: c-type cytochrome [Cognatishimia sp.]